MRRQSMKWTILVFAALILLFWVHPVSAQCPMCRIAAESNLNNGGTSGKGLNNGILYMLAMPYMMVGLMGFIWWRNRRKDVDRLTPEDGDDSFASLN